MINRREFLGITAGASLALTPELLRALQQSGGKLIQRGIPSTGEMLPVISFNPQQESDTAGMKDILKTLVDNGGKVIGPPHGGGESLARSSAEELGTQNKFFWATTVGVAAANMGPVLPGVVRKPDPAAVRAAMEAKLAEFKVSKIDLVMVSTLGDVPAHLAVLREMKKEGRVRYVGVQHLAWLKPSPAPFRELEAIMRNEQVDFVATDYSVADRRAEETILPLAVERKIAFMANFTFDRGKLFQRAASTPLPEWAAEFDARTWAQFFLKYVVSHPGVTVARTGTTKAPHMLDNIGGGIGRLPNAAMRSRMAQLVDLLPEPPAPPAPSSSSGRMLVTPEQMKDRLANLAPTVALSAAILDRYVGEYKHEAAGTIVTIRREGDRLLVKVQGNPPEEFPFVARSETRFASVLYVIEFQLDAQEKVTGATWGQGPNSIPLVRR